MSDDFWQTVIAVWVGYIIGMIVGVAIS